MARTAELSWLQVSNKCTNVIISILPSFPFLVATVICHGRPLLPNRSVWLSLNFFGRYFLAQSKTSKTEVSSSSSMTYSFQEFMHCLDCKVTKAKSSFVSVVPPTSCTALSILATTEDENIGRMCGCGCDGKFQGSLCRLENLARRLDNGLVDLSSLKCVPIN